jgi:hypothetical protein
VKKQTVTEWTQFSKRNRTERRKKSIKIWTNLRKQWTGGTIRLSNNQKKRKNKRSNLLICRWHIKIAFICSEISPQIADGIVAEVSQTRLSSVLKISRGDTDSGKILYIVYRGQQIKRVKTRFYLYSISIYSMYTLHYFSFKSDIILDVFIGMFFAAHHQNCKSNDWLLVWTNAKTAKEEQKKVDT